MRLFGKKVILRPLTKKDLQACFRWVQDPSVTRYTRFPIPKTMREERNWFLEFKKSIKTERIFAILNKKPGKFIGNTGVHKIDQTHKKCSVGILIGEKDHWNKGFGTDAMKTVLKYCFKKLKLYKVSLVVDPKNKRGIRCYEKCGFRKEGYLKDDDFYKGKRYDSILMAVFSPRSRSRL